MKRWLLSLACLGLGACAAPSHPAPTAPPTAPDCPRAAEATAEPEVEPLAHRRARAVKLLDEGHPEEAESILGALVAGAPDDSVLVALHEAALNQLRIDALVANSGLRTAPRVIVLAPTALKPSPAAKQPIVVKLAQSSRIPTARRPRRGRGLSPGDAPPPGFPPLFDGFALRRVFGNVVVYGSPKNEFLWVTLAEEHAQTVLDPSALLHRAEVTSLVPQWAEHADGVVYAALLGEKFPASIFAIDEKSGEVRWKSASVQGAQNFVLRGSWLATASGDPLTLNVVNAKTGGLGRALRVTKAVGASDSPTELRLTTDGVELVTRDATHAFLF